MFKPKFAEPQRSREEMDSAHNNNDHFSFGSSRMYGGLLCSVIERHVLVGAPLLLAIRFNGFSFVVVIPMGICVYMLFFREICLY